MNMIIDSDISKYIDTAVERLDAKYEDKINIAIERERLVFNRDMHQAFGAYQEAIRHDLKIVLELVSDRPTRGEMERGFSDIKEELRHIRGSLAVHEIQLKELAGKNV